MVGDAGLALHRFGLLQVSELAAPAEVGIELIDRNSVLEFWTCAVEQSLLTPVRGNCFKRSVCIDAALFVELGAAVSENREGNHANHQQNQRQRTAADEELLHASNENKIRFG